MIERLTASARAAHPEVEYDVRVVHGPTAANLLAAAEGSDLVLLARAHRLVPPHGHLGAVAQNVLSRSDVPVLVVPYAAQREEPPAPAAHDS